VIAFAVTAIFCTIGGFIVGRYHAIKTLCEKDKND